MNTYLVIITTVLVVTQLIRITQNQIFLFKQRKKIDNTLAWIKDNDVSERDFDVQRKVSYLLFDKLMKEQELEDEQ